MNPLRRATFPSCFLGIVVAALLCFINPSPSMAQESTTCGNHGPAQDGYIAKYHWEFRPAKNPQMPEDFICHIFLYAPTGKLVFQAKDWDVSLETVSGQDINGDGEPDIVFEGYSGGAHCCWTYWIVSLGASPGLLKEIHNERGLEFMRTSAGGPFELWTLDGSFDYFHGLSHGGTFFPDLILRFQGRDLRDVSASHWSVYEKAIIEARKQLTPERIAKFRNIDFQKENDEDTAHLVLTIVLEELYGGKTADAWRDLGTLWPEKDLERMRNDILKARKNGVLRCLGTAPSPHSC